MKLKSLNDLPEYPAGTLFYRDTDSKGRNVWCWQYKGDHAMVGSDWLVNLLNYQIPQINDEHTDFFEAVTELGDTYYAVNFNGTISEFTLYSWWGNPDAPNVLRNKATAEALAAQISAMLRAARQKEAA